MLGSPILYLKGMRILMFQLSGFYCRGLGELASGLFRSNGLVRCQHTWVMGTLILSLALSLSLPCHHPESYNATHLNWGLPL